MCNKGRTKEGEKERTSRKERRMGKDDNGKRERREGIKETGWKRKGGW